jgi:hypothetical protein
MTSKDQRAPAEQHFAASHGVLGYARGSSRVASPVLAYVFGAAELLIAWLMMVCWAEHFFVENVVLCTCAVVTAAHAVAVLLHRWCPQSLMLALAMVALCAQVALLTSGWSIAHTVTSGNDRLGTALLSLQAPLRTAAAVLAALATIVAALCAKRVRT